MCLTRVKVEGGDKGVSRQDEVEEREMRERRFHGRVQTKQNRVFSAWFKPGLKVQTAGEREVLTKKMNRREIRKEKRKK